MTRECMSIVTRKQRSLNPCCNGILPDLHGRVRRMVGKSVLILVVMEYSLTREGWEIGNTEARLNPCCNGILPDSEEYKTSFVPPSVLILVVMEYSLTNSFNELMLK